MRPVAVELDSEDLVRTGYVVVYLVATALYLDLTLWRDGPVELGLDGRGEYPPQKCILQEGVRVEDVVGACLDEYPLSSSAPRLLPPVLGGPSLACLYFWQGALDPC